VSKATIVETRRQHFGVGITQSLNAGITTIGVGTIVAPNIDVVKRGILIGSIAKLGSGLGGVLARRNLSQSSVLPTTSIRVVGIPQMVFINSITSTHRNMTANRPLMSSMAIRGCIIADTMYSRGGYRKPIVVIAPILNHKDGHYVRPNKVVFKYPNFKKDVDLVAHVRVFNSIVKTNAKTSEKYIINVFNYMLKDMASD